MPDDGPATPTDPHRHRDAGGDAHTGPVRELLGAIHDAPRRTPADAAQIDACWSLWQHLGTWLEGQFKSCGSLSPRWHPEQIFTESVRDRVRDQLVLGAGFRQIRTPAASWGFVRTTVRHAALDERRHLSGSDRDHPRWHVSVDAPLAGGQDVRAQFIDAQPTGRGGDDPETLLIATERRRLLARSLQEVSARHRDGRQWLECLRRHCLGGHTHQHIAEAMGVTRRTVQRWEQKGQAAVRAVLKDRGIEPRHLRCDAC